MTEKQILWVQARDRLMTAVTALGFPAELASIMAQQLKSPQAMDRMTAYIGQARPHSVEMLVDEMLAICDEIETWRQRKASQEAQAHYTALRYSGALGQEESDDG